MADPSEEHRDLHEVLDSDTQGISVTWSGSNADDWSKMTLDVADGEALAGLLGEVEDVAGDQLDGLDHAHGGGL